MIIRHLTTYRMHQKGSDFWTPDLRLLVYLSKLDGTLADPGWMWLQNLETGTIQYVEIAQFEALLLPLHDTPPRWPKPKDVINGYREVFYFHWENDTEGRYIGSAHKETRAKYLARVRWFLERETLMWPKVGHIYRAIKPRPVPRFGPDMINDIQILHIPEFIFGPDTGIQYDAASLKFGSRYPKMTLIEFWAAYATDVTEEYTATVKDGEWMEWRQAHPPKAA